MAVDYIRERWGLSVTRSTLYNWMNKGLRGRKLRHVKIGGRYTTKKGWLDEFLANK